MYAPRLGIYLVTTLVCFTGAAQAQGPWPTMNRPTFFSPVQEFFTPRSYTSNHAQPMYSQSPSTPINPGVPQCANGRCRQSNLNGQSLMPSQSDYQPGGYVSGNTRSGRCANGVCGSNGNCPNGQCGPGNVYSGGNGNYGTSRVGLPSTSIGLRPLTPNSAAPRSGNLNRLILLDNGAPVNGGYTVPQGPMYQDRESMVPQEQNYANDPGVRLQ